MNKTNKYVNTNKEHIAREIEMMIHKRNNFKITVIAYGSKYELI